MSATNRLISSLEERAGKAEAAVASLEAEREALRVALEPFAAVLGMLDPNEAIFEDNELVFLKGEYAVTFGDFRRARALSSSKGGGNG